MPVLALVEVMQPDRRLRCQSLHLRHLPQETRPRILDDPRHAMRLACVNDFHASCQNLVAESGRRLISGAEARNAIRVLRTPQTPRHFRPRRRTPGRCESVARHCEHDPTNPLLANQKHNIIYCIRCQDIVAVANIQKKRVWPTGQRCGAPDTTHAAEEIYEELPLPDGGSSGSGSSPTTYC